MGMMPDGDKINVDTATISIDAETIKMDSIFIKSIQGYLGDYFDPLYGNIKSGFMCQFYPMDIVFPDSVINNEIDSVKVLMAYRYSIGDSLSAMEASVYRIKQALPKNFYSTLNLAEYCDLKTVYGKRAYSARNYNAYSDRNISIVSDSIYKALPSDNYILLDINLPVSIGEEFLKEWRKSESTFKSKGKFVNFFNGLYFTTTFGKGSLIRVDGTMLEIYFKGYSRSTEGVDITDTLCFHFPVTKEVIQLNTIEDANEDILLAENPTTMYIKAPSGICPKLIIPIDELVNKFEGKELSNVQLSLYGEEVDLKKSSLKYPARLLLIPPDSVKTFFENQKLIDKTTTYSASWNNYVYDFSNISYVIQKAMNDYVFQKANNEKTNNKLELLVMPVSPIPFWDNNGQMTEIGYNNLLTPSVIALKKGKNYMQLRIIAVEKKRR